MDNRSSEAGSDERPQGMSTLDLLTLAPGPRKLMRIMLRCIEIPYAELRQSLEEGTAHDRLLAPNLDAMLQDLTNHGWLVQHDSEQGPVYRINLHRKAGSISAQRARPRLSQDFWTALDAAPAPNPPDQPDSSTPQES